MRAQFLMLCFIVSGCATDSACREMRERLLVSRAFCEQMAQERAVDMCRALDDEELKQCLQVVELAVIPDCISQTGADRVAWAYAQFCK